MTDEELDRDPEWHEIQVQAKKDSDFREEIAMVLEFHGRTIEDLRAMVASHDYRKRIIEDKCASSKGDCIDCGVNTFDLGEYYNVHDRIWASAGMGSHDGMLCIGCLEKRIGRKLEPGDFGYCLINHDPLYFRSSRFFNRLGWGEYA